MRNETKIGLLLVVCIIGLIWGLKFLKGVNILNPSNAFYAEYPYAELNPSTPVKINGIQVGVVTEVFLKPEDLSTVVVWIDVDGDIKVPTDARIQIASSSLLGDKVVRLDFDRPCDGSNCAESGSQLKGETMGIVQSMIDTESIDDMMDRAKSGAAGIFDTLSYKLSNSDTESETMIKINSIITNLDQMSRSMNRMMNQSSSTITSMLTNIESITANLSRNNDELSGILSNTNKLTGELSNAGLSAAVDSTKMLMSTANTTLGEFEKTLVSAKSTMDEMTLLMGDMNKSKGSLGLLMKDEELYKNMANATKNLDLLLQDFRLNPKRYTTILKKKSPVYTLPENDPAKQD